VDQTELTGNRYVVSFLDTQVDGIDNNENGLIDEADSTEWERTTSLYFVFDTEVITESFVGLDTAVVKLVNENLDSTTVIVRDEQGSTVDPARYILSASRGTIRGSSAGTLPRGNYTITYAYYPVFSSPNIQGSPFLVENAESDIFDGVTINFNNYWYIKDTLSEWVGQNPYVYNLSAVDLPLLSPPLLGYKRPADYEIRFSDTIVDTSSVGPFPLDQAIPVNFRIFNTTEARQLGFYFIPGPNPAAGNTISPLSEVVFLEEDPRGMESETWDVFFINKPGEPVDTVYDLGEGDGLILRTTKPYRRGDVFELQTELPEVDPQLAASSLDRIRAVPNPYITAAAFELPLPPGITSGRGERRIDFNHVPASSTIKIFTATGEYVVTLTGSANIEDGTISWNLKTRENLDIAYGVYFYVVESPVGNKTGKIAIIK
ncbi:MAG: hypothetical protein KAJ12_00435, partial [Bacteroidetes bacterium]|nr:hypothetical protein [Bacteroidota bacterium]